MRRLNFGHLKLNSGVQEVPSFKCHPWCPVILTATWAYESGSAVEHGGQETLSVGGNLFKAARFGGNLMAFTDTSQVSTWEMEA